ncbi:MAG TPA: ATP phosphoribosyltransferase regulatory subunit [Burkholderiales bacterium]|nr:ATP phosphoribosyltransferase regulatory subunit [Burkholderiales bacterium]
MRSWLLPDYIEDILPPEARRIEELRRAILDLFYVHGYQLVIPPLIEYVESLLTGTGRDMDLKTFKLVDQLSGRMMGLRADITPQVARIDAHLLNREGITRLCYCGSVAHTLPSTTVRSREPLQIGAELYGHGGLESDIEILRLMLQALKRARVAEVHLDLGHVAIFRSIARRGKVPAELEAELFGVLQTKDRAALRELTTGIDSQTSQALLSLLELYGGDEVLAGAAKCLPEYPEISAALAGLQAFSKELRDKVASLGFDLAEMRGYRYHSGVVFSAYAKSSANAIAVGGRYDEVGKAFGRARPATGFSMDLREVSALHSGEPWRSAILAPYLQDTALQKKIASLREQGEIVIEDLSRQGSSPGDLNCDRTLVLRNGVWEISSLK